MKILHVAWLDNNKSNGVSVVVPNHIKYQSALVQVALLNTSNISLDIPEEEINYPIFSLGDCPQGNIGLLPSPFNDPDIVIFHGVYFYYYYKTMGFLLNMKIPYIVIPHGSLTSFAQEKKKWKKKIGNILVFNKFINNSRCIQFLTQEEKISSNWEGESFICGNGMSSRTCIVDKKKNSDFFHFTYIGRLALFQKGLDILLEACYSISDEMRGKKIKLNIYGPDDQGDKKKVLHLIEKYKIQDIVCLSNPVYGKEKEKILQNSDVFVLTSRFEGQPLSVIEALLMGIPVLLTPGTNIANEVVSNNCGWCAELSVKDVADKILEIFNLKKQIAQYSLNASKYAEKNYSWEEIAKKTVSGYKKLLR
ncbi:Glycosyltransferase involved in cell wall bisynthesis [Paenibacillus sophorae]|uniref:Glycosyltransferase n=1 Tax=Paenibacillus sophorae TaxID=1333845 RepID=A0A1H8QGW6_9BACL|nr:glycosyltransferase [Paenibacillus sophorae]QWU15126.1 glycosyltransferase [Paenibacillus sophorae]SEO53470.1 Glycosyltransferase involved in cell wall bisynthesis [Paenibacillus sophorae]